MRTLVESGGRTEVKERTDSKCCFICFGSHYMKNCSVTRYQRGLCFKCDLDKMHGVNLHSGFSRSDCRLGVTKALAWYVWQVRNVRQRMIKTLMTESDRQEVGVMLCPKTNVYILVPAGRNLTAEQRYSTWMRLGDPVRNQIKVCMWWVTQYKFISEVVA